MEFPYSRKTFRCCNSHSANTYFATEFVSSKINVIPYPSTLNYKLSVRTATAKFWHEHLLNFDTNIWSYRRTWLSENTLKFLIGSWQKTDGGIRTDKGRRRTLKPIYQSTNCSEKICLIIIPTSSRICLKQRKHSEVQQARNTGFWKRRYTKENSSSSLHTQWAIDQGATRLGGL